MSIAKDGIVACGVVALWFALVTGLVELGLPDVVPVGAVALALMAGLIWAALRWAHKSQESKPDGDEVPF